MNNLTVYKANEIIEASYRLTLNEQRVVLACISQVNSAEKLLETDKFELSAKSFAKLFGISEQRAYSELQSITKTLYQRSVTIHNPDPNYPSLTKLETRWISSIGYIPDAGKIVLYFSHKILPYLSELKGSFTKYELKHVGNMSSIYAIRLYELLMQWKTTGSREVEIEWLKKQFQIEDKYPSIKDLKKYVIEPAMKDINTHSNYTVTWTQRKTGRAVTHFIFEFGEKTPLAPEKPKRVVKPREKKILGVAESEIKAKAKPGESYEQAATRIAEEKEKAAVKKAKAD